MRWLVFAAFLAAGIEVGKTSVSDYIHSSCLTFDKFTLDEISYQCKEIDK